MLASRSAAESRRRLPGRLLLAITAGILLPIAGLIASRIPSGEVVDAASSQRFWSLLYIRALEVEHYDSLATMAQASDTVLVGVVESVRLSRQVGESYPISYAVVTIRPRDILKGPDSELVSLEVVLPSSDMLTALTNVRYRGQSRSGADAGRSLNLPHTGRSSARHASTTT